MEVVNNRREYIGRFLSDILAVFKFNSSGNIFLEKQSLCAKAKVPSSRH